MDASLKSQRPWAVSWACPSFAGGDGASAFCAFWKPRLLEKTVWGAMCAVPLVGGPLQVSPL